MKPFTWAERTRAKRFVNQELGFDWLGWIGMLAGCAGALVLSFHVGPSRFGWPLYLISSTALIIRYRHDRAMLTQQAVYIIIASIGIWRWFA